MKAKKKIKLVRKKVNFEKNHNPLIGKLINQI
jgi:hypothetical protein